MWRAGKPQDDFDFPSISDYLVEDDTLVWCDIYDPDHAILKDLAQELSLNSWAVEDAIAEAERTKAVVYRTHTFFTVYGVSTKEPADETQSMLDIHRISGFVLPRGLITVRLSPHFDIDAVSQRFDELGGQEYGVGSLVHGLLDVVVDGHFEAVQALDDGIESIEDDLFANNPRRACSARRSVCARISSNCGGWCCRCVRSSAPSSIADSTPRPRRSWIRCTADLYDHVLRVSEWTESLRDMVTTVFETNLSLQDARLNTVMKKLTGWAAIIAVPTAITGFYGQNVEYPGINTVGGFVTSTSIIVLIVLALYWMFRRRDWL